MKNIKKQTSKKYKYTKEDFIELAILKHGDKYDYSKVIYVNNKTKVIITCPIHGDFEQQAGSHLSGNECRKCSYNRIRNSYEEFVNKANIVHNNRYDYSKVIYVNNKTKVIITCPIHGDFEQIVGSHLRGDGCQKCYFESQFLTRQQFIERSTIIHDNRYDYSKVIYVNNKTKIIITCPIHGDFEQIVGSHLNGSECKKCSHDKQRNTIQDFIHKANIVHDNKYDYSKVIYINCNSKITISCPIHGNFEIAPAMHLRGGGCQKCSYTRRRNSYEEFVNKANIVHNNRYDYSKVIYVNNKTKVLIVCPFHGNFFQTPNNHLNDDGCPKCIGSISKISQTWLDHIGVSNIVGQTREVWVKVSPDKKFKADGFDPSTNTVYEFHGDFWHGNLNIYPEDFINPINKKTMGQLLKETQERSRLIRDAGYNLVSIWESDWRRKQKELKENDRSENSG